MLFNRVDQLGNTDRLGEKWMSLGVEAPFDLSPGYERCEKDDRRVMQLGISLDLHRCYYDNSENRKYIRRWNGQNDNGDVFSYDPADQIVGVQLDVPSPQNVQSVPWTIIYDANGNRFNFSPYGPTDTYTINNLNQYSKRNNIDATYDFTGNLAQSPDSGASQLTCTYDAQNRLLTATKSGGTDTFKYDGLNRQVSRAVTGQPTIYNVWDGWDLVQEYHMSGNNAVEDASYLYGATGLVKNLLTNNYYYQDGSGSTSHLANSSGVLQEWYRYDLQGTPVFYDANNNQRAASAYGVRHLFTGQQWYSELGLYDLRNRFYSPDIGRFLQPDPIGFDGDPTNLYCYAGNNPVVYADPTGLFRGGQFAVGVVTLASGPGAIIGGAALSSTGVGAIAGVPFMLSGVVGFGYGIGNIVASFSNLPGAAEFQSSPSSLPGVGGRIVAGETGQRIVESVEDSIEFGTAKTAFDKVTGAISLGLDLYEAGSLLTQVSVNPVGPPTNLNLYASPRYVFLGVDESGYAYIDNVTGRVVVVGFPVKAYGYDIETLGRNSGLGISRGSTSNVALGGLGGVGFYFEGGANYSGFGLGPALSYILGPGSSLFGGASTAGWTAQLVKYL
jgi:RHS repeat-associated protein